MQWDRIHRQFHRAWRHMTIFNVLPWLRLESHRFRNNAGLAGPLFLARTVTQSGALIGSIETHDFSRRRTVRTIHRVMTPPPLPVGNPPSKIELILVEPTVDTERCVASAISRLSPNSFVESGLGQIYLSPRPENMCGFLSLKKA